MTQSAENGNGPRKVSLLSDEWVHAVANTPENDLRAHRITLTYSRLARRLDRLVHGTGRGPVSTRITRAASM